MRSFGFRLTFLVAILWTGIGSTVWALGHHGDAIETVYVMPTSVTLPVPTSYVVSTAWVEPTAFAVPTYYTTAYWMDPVVLAQPAYAETAYVRRRGLFGRRWEVERPVVATYATSYVPTSYFATSYLPTTYYATPTYRATSYAVADRLVVPSAYVTPVECVCPPLLASAAPTYASPSRDTGAATPGTGSRPRTRQSEPNDRSSMRSDVEDLNPVGSAGAAGASNTNVREAAPGDLPDLPGGVRDTSPSPPAAPRPQPPPNRQGATQQQPVTPSGANPSPGQTGTTPGTGGANPSGGTTTNPRAGTPARPSGANTGGNPAQGSNTGTIPPPTAPTAPGEADPNAPPPIGPPGETRHESMRPSNYGTQAVRPSLRNILVGTVLANADREPEEGVRIRVRSLAGGSGKDTTTNAFGRFAVRLPDGDWAVEVATRSGRVYEVSQIRVADGVITDSQGRRVPSLEITR